MIAKLGPFVLSYL